MFNSICYLGLEFRTNQVKKSGILNTLQLQLPQFFKFDLHDSTKIPSLEIRPHDCEKSCDQSKLAPLLAGLEAAESKDNHE